jgi:hypothetical protein
MESIMGNPAMAKRKKTEKRRKKYEQRLGPGVYLPKAEREKVNAAVKQAEAETKKKAEQHKKERAAKKKEAAAAKPAPGPKAEKPAKEEKK